MKHPAIELRAEGLLIHDRLLLLAQHTRDDEKYWVLPGGHVESGEDLSETLCREFQEELSLDVVPGPLLWVHQFIRSDRHTVNFTFRVECADIDALRLNPGRRLIGCQWFSPDQLSTLDFRPDLSELCAEVLRGRLPRNLGVYRF